MATTYTTRARLAKQGTGDNQDTWGTVLNTSVFDLVDEAISGVHEVDVNTGLDIVLSVNNGASDEARNMVLKLSGEPTNDINVIIPNQEKLYIVDGNDFTGSNTVTVKGSTGTGVAISEGKSAVVICDGTDVREIYQTPDPEVVVEETFAGDHKYSERSSDHGRWLLNDGRTLDSITNTEYADLFSVIGTRYGGTGASNFKLPNDSGLIVGALDNLTGSNANVVTDANASIEGGLVGTEKQTPTGTVEGHALTADEMSHKHETTVSSAAAIGSAVFGRGSTSFSTSLEGGGGSGSSSGGHFTNTPESVTSDTHDHGLTMDEQSNMQPTRFIYSFTRY